MQLSDDEYCYGKSSRQYNYATLSVVDYDKMENVPRSRVRMIKYIQSRFTEQPMHAFMEQEMLIVVEIID